MSDPARLGEQGGAPRPNYCARCCHLAARDPRVPIQECATTLVATAPGNPPIVAMTGLCSSCSSHEQEQRGRAIERGLQEGRIDRDPRGRRKGEGA